jgi:hypothetical protein
MMGPAVVTTIGVLFLVSELGSGYFHIGHTYPVLFIMIGVILLASSLTSMDGHVEAAVPPTPPPVNPAPPAAPPTYSNPYAGQGQ